MGVILYILFLIFCIFAGFNGMPYMFIFPIATMTGIIVMLFKNKDLNEQSKVEQREKKNEDDMQDIIFWDKIYKR